MLQRLILVLILLANTLTRAFDFPTNAAARILSISPFPATVAAATHRNIPTQTIDPFVADSKILNSGDSITALVTLNEPRSKQTQWLIYLQAVADISLPTNAPRSVTIYNSFGHQFDFPSTPASVTLCTMGPFIESISKSKPPKTIDTTAHFHLNQGFLALGLDQEAKAISRLDPKRKKKASFFNGPAPYTAEQIAASKQATGTWRLTLDEERALAGSFPALTSFFEVIQHTDSLAEILTQAIDRPSVFSLASNFGIKTVGFHGTGAWISPEPPAAWNLSNPTPIYELPTTLNLNDHPSLHFTMVVTAPQPPLLASAGILGILAQHPTKPDLYLTIRILSAHRVP